MQKAKKSLGQNFLQNKNIAEKMVKALDLKDVDEVIEIGPGQGALTEIILANNNNHLKAVEIDRDMINYLISKFPKEVSENKLNIIEENILDFLPKYKAKTKVKIIGSLPYYITSPIVHKICYMEEKPEIAILMVQREVATKIMEEAPKNNYMATFIQTFYEISLVTWVDKTDFYPIPKVDSAVIKLKRKQQEYITQNKIKKYEGFLHRAYSNPRKMLNKVFSEEEITAAGFDSTKRPQNIEYKKWIEVFKILVK